MPTNPLQDIEKLNAAVADLERKLDAAKAHEMDARAAREKANTALAAALGKLNEAILRHRASV